MADEEPAAQSQRGPSSRRTRSQAAPEWSAVAELVLVNEIAAVESDCATELSSYQKWKIIAENCAAQDVPRTLSQCRRKWDSLLEDYRRVQKFESLRSRKASAYWSLQSERREKLGLPRSFDRALFAAIGDLLRARENRPESEPDEDPEAKDDGAETVEDLGTLRFFIFFFSFQFCCLDLLFRHLCGNGLLIIFRLSGFVRKGKKKK